jgi:hypothetical protein
MNLDEDTLLRRGPFAQELTNVGYPIKAATLATMASRGGGSPYELWGSLPLYRWGPGLRWARDRLRAPVRSTSEASPQKGAGATRAEIREPKGGAGAIVGVCTK